MPDKADLVFNIDAILSFANTLNDEIGVHLNNEISFFNNARYRIAQQGDVPSEEELRSVINNLVDKIIRWNPVIEKQLVEFWRLQLGIIHERATKKCNVPYVPITRINNRLKEANKIHANTVSRIKEDDSQIVYYYAMFYSLISRSEVIEQEIRKHLRYNMVHVGLPEVDLDNIFYVNEKIPRGSKYTTDVKAMRHALSHLKFRIEAAGGYEWRIHFDNRYGGFDFRKIMGKNSFRKFCYDLEMLFKSIFLLSIVLYVISAAGRLRKMKT